MNARSLKSEAKSARYVKDDARRLKHTVRARKWDKQWVITCPATSLRLYKWVPVKESPGGGIKKVIKVQKDSPPQEIHESPNEETNNKAESQDVVEEMLVEHKQDSPSPVSSHGELTEQPTSPPIDPASD